MDGNIKIETEIGTIEQFQSQLLAPTVEKLSPEISTVVNKIIIERPEVITEIISELIKEK